MPTPPDGHVTLPLSAWEALAPRSVAQAPPYGVLPVSRSLRGRLDRGLFEGVLAGRFEVASGDAPIALVPTEVTLSGATLDGRPAAPAERDGRWAIAAGPGAHDVEVGVLHGRLTERFGRALALDLGPGGPVAFDLVVPETPIDPTLAGGVITVAEAHAGGTRLQGWLDGTGRLDLTWERRPTHALDPAAAELEARALAVLELGEDVVRGRARYVVRVREGEVDRFSLALPDGVEVVDVTGPAVLQWHTEAQGRLVVLLRHVADDAFDADVVFQYPARPDDPVPLWMPLPDAEITKEGALGVVAPVGLEVVRTHLAAARALEPRDVPADLAALTTDPLRLAVAFDDAPEVEVRATRQPDVAVSPTRIDDLQGITVLVADGTEVGKLKLTVRNTSRQLLTVDLPPGARLTHCFRDGVPLRPAADAERPERILVPLTRSERAAAGASSHRVDPGETLSGIALARYGSASAWPRIARANALGDGGEVMVGQVLTLPADDDAPLEQAFVLELGWERRTPPLGQLGARSVGLPALDLEVMDATWHLYLPGDVEPLALDATLPGLEALHPDPVSRVLGWVADTGLGGASAYASDTFGYRSSLSLRRDWYEAKQKNETEVQTDPFPLVGRRWRFHGVLPGIEPVSADLVYLGSAAADGVRAAALGGAGLLAFAAARWPRTRVVAAVGLAVGLVAAHHVLGVHRRIAWGADLGLLAAIGLRVLAGARMPRPSGRTAAVALLAMPLLAFRPELVPVALLGALLLVDRRLA